MIALHGIVIVAVCCLRSWGLIVCTPDKLLAVFRCDLLWPAQLWT